MQSNVIKAFRKRLSHLGYTEIHIIVQADKKHYTVTAIDPLGGSLITATYTEYEMYFSLNRQKKGSVSSVKRVSISDFDITGYLVIDTDIKFSYYF